MGLEKETHKKPTWQSNTVQYERIIRDFLQNDQGCFITLTDDHTLLSMLCNFISKDLGLARTGFIHTIDKAPRLFKDLSQLQDDGLLPFLLIEHRYNGADMSIRIREYKQAFPDIFILVLTTDLEQDTAIYLHELGADNFITKPVSLQTLIEKIALTIKPQGKLGSYIDEAKALLANGLSYQARQIVDKILEYKPGSAAGLMILGDVERAEKNLEAAKAAYLAASNNAALYIEPLCRLADLAEDSGDLNEMLAYLEQLDKLSPLNINRKITMGKINLSLGAIEKAEKLFEAVLNQVQKTTNEHISTIAEQIAGVYADINAEKYEAFLQKALIVKKELALDDLHIFNKLGISLRKRGKWQEAIDEYKRALKIAPKNEQLYYNIAMAYIQGERYIDARSNLEKALKYNPKLPYSSPLAAYNMGIIFKKNSDKDNAVACFEAALEQDSTFAAAMQELRGLV